MINHVRTLLMNRDGRAVVPDWTIGEVLVDPAYRPPVLPGYLRNLRSSLFGASSDRSFMNYRLAQYTALLAATELQEYVLQLDPRLTYPSPTLGQLFSAATFVPVWITPDGLPVPAVIGQPTAPDQRGQMFYSCEIDVLSSSTVAVIQQTPARSEKIFDYTLAQGSSTVAFPLGDSGYSFYLPAAANGSQWLMTCNNRPTWDLGQLAALVTNSGTATLSALFGPDPAEPYLTFYNLFNANQELAYQLGGLLLAVAWRTEALRTNPNG